MDPWVAQFEFVVEGFLLRLFLISFLGAEVDILYDYDWIVARRGCVTRDWRERDCSRERDRGRPTLLILLSHYNDRY